MYNETIIIFECTNKQIIGYDRDAWIWKKRLQEKKKILSQEEDIFYMIGKKKLSPTLYFSVNFV